MPFQDDSRGDEEKLNPSEGHLLLGEDSYSADEHVRHQPVRHWRQGLRPFHVHGILIFLYSVLYVALVIPTALRTVPGRDPEEPPEAGHIPRLPSREALIWEKRRFPTDITDNPLAGDPRPELDEAWHRLLLNDNILVPKDYLDELNLTSIYTRDGLHGVASLSVYHCLHCLKKVKRMLFKEHYHKGKSEEAMAREAKHVDHCVEYIREALMCQPDLSLVTFRWINNTAQHEDKSAFYPTNFDVSMHTCARWEPLDEWAGGRRFNLFDVDLLQRPQPDGHT